MSFIRILVLIVTVLVGFFGDCTMSNAAIPGNAGPENIQAAHNYLPFVKPFGMTEIAFAQVSDDSRSMTIEYLPKGQKIDSWTRLATVTLNSGGSTMPENIGAVRQFIANMRSLVLQRGKELSFDIYHGPQGEPLALMRYVLGNDDQKEYSAQLIWIASPGYVTSLQVQTRGTDNTIADAQKLKQLARLPQ